MHTSLEQGAFPPPLPKHLDNLIGEGDPILRGVAFTIVHFLFVIVAVVSSFAAMSGSFSNKELSSKSVFSILGIGLAIFSLYYLKDMFQGRSIDKWMMNLQVRDNNNLNEVPSIFGSSFGMYSTICDQ